MKNGALLFLGLLASAVCFAQDSVFHWKASSQKTGNNQYELIFSTTGNPQWQLYAPDQTLSDVPTTELQFADSSIQTSGTFKATGAVKNEQSALFDMPIKLFEGTT